MMKSNRRKTGRGFVFVTGTDTGVGKTLLTAMLLVHARRIGHNVLAAKPFCSGDRGDLEVLNAAQNGNLPGSLLNIFYSSKPVAPLLAARLAKQNIGIEQVLERLRMAKTHCELLLIEGAGGLLAPLGENYDALDLIKKLECPVVLVARNRLGVINHILMTHLVLQHHGVKDVTVVMLGCENPDISVRSNAGIVRELIGAGRVFEVPFLGAGASSEAGIEKSVKKIKKTLALIWRCVKTFPVNRTPERGVERKTGQRRKSS